MLVVYLQSELAGYWKGQHHLGGRYEVFLN
jgi:hypothetical protein